MEIKIYLFELSKLIEELQPDDEKIIKKMKELMEIIYKKDNKDIFFNLYEKSADWLCHGNVILCFGNEKEKRSCDNIEYIKLAEKINEHKLKLKDIKNDWIKEYSSISNYF